MISCFPQFRTNYSFSEMKYDSRPAFKAKRQSHVALRNVILTSLGSNLRSLINQLSDLLQNIQTLCVLLSFSIKERQHGIA